MKTIQQWFDEYAESHQNPVNKAIHWICVPAIFFSLVCLLSIPAVTIPMSETESMHLSLASLIILLVMLFYLRLSVPIALGIGVFSVICLFLAKQLSLLSFPLWGTALIIFAVAWIGQFIGHKIEGKKPSFLKDLQFLLIGPAWLMSFIFRKLDINY